MDAHTLDKLEFDQIRRILAREAQSALGRGLAMKIAPSRSLSQVQGWRTQVNQFERFVTARGFPPFGGIRDVRDMVKRAVPPAKLEPREFAELSETLTAIESIRRYFAVLDDQYDLIKKLAARLGDFRVVTERIDLVVDNRGLVRDDASERLWRIRRQVEDVVQRTRDVFDRLLRSASVTRLLQYANATFHADRMVLPLKADQRGRIAGIVHRSSDSGQTLFVEPAEAVELNNTRVNLLLEEQDEISRILWELTHLVHLNQQDILRTLDAAAVVDLLTAKVKLGRRYKMCLPEINDGHRMLLRQARNPILLELFETLAADGQPRNVVPIDVRLGDDFDIMVITGPNTGGKTAALKTVGLLVLMAQSGLPIPAAEGSTMPVLDGIWIDVGDEQSLEQSLSTFSAHMARILDIVQRARKQTLVLLDELGAGTDPDEGAAIGRAIIDHLLSAGCLAMVTTHLGALKTIGYQTQRVDNASVQFDVESLRPMYELRIGEPGNSNAIAIASRLGMPKALVQSARKHLAGQQRALNRAIAGTLRSRREAERARRDADQARQEAARATLAAMDQAKALEDRQRMYAAWVERILRLQPGDEVYVRKFDTTGRVVRVRFEKQVAYVNLGTLEVEVPLVDVVFPNQDLRET
ncbi:MAG: MutS2/Smr-associated SH3 domain-containing protein [Planctomycetota bacterium]